MYIQCMFPETLVLQVLHEQQVTFAFKYKDYCQSVSVSSAQADYDRRIEVSEQSIGHVVLGS